MMHAYISSGNPMPTERSKIQIRIVNGRRQEGGKQMRSAEASFPSAILDSSSDFIPQPDPLPDETFFPIFEPRLHIFHFPPEFHIDGG